MEVEKNGYTVTGFVCIMVLKRKLLPNSQVFHTDSKSGVNTDNNESQSCIIKTGVKQESCASSGEPNDCMDGG